MLGAWIENLVIVHRRVPDENFIQFSNSTVTYSNLSSKLQGDRTVKVGVVDEEYIVHLGLPTLGGSLDKNKVCKYCTLTSARNSTQKFLEFLWRVVFKWEK